MKNTVAIIPARSGSLELPHKNINFLLSKPLIGYTIEAALASKLFDDVIVSTDSAEYAKIAQEFGASVPFLRNRILSDDSTPLSAVTLDLLEKLKQHDNSEYRYAAILQPTSPLRNSSDICSAFQLLLKKKADAVVSVCETENSPIFSSVLPENLCLHNFIKEEFRNTSRQEQPRYYKIHGAIVWIRTAHYQQTQNLYTPNSFAYIMPRARSIDIDSKLDLEMAEFLLSKQQKEILT